jgi:hypothetical protein
VPASTIHGLIYQAEEAAWLDAQERHRVQVVWHLKEPREVEREGFLVDEASMVSRELHEALTGLPQEKWGRG